MMSNEFSVQYDHKKNQVSLTFFFTENVKFGPEKMTRFNFGNVVNVFNEDAVPPATYVDGFTMTFGLDFLEHLKTETKQCGLFNAVKAFNFDGNSQHIAIEHILSSTDNVENIAMIHASCEPKVQIGQLSLGSGSHLKNVFDIDSDIILTFEGRPKCDHYALSQWAFNLRTILETTKVWTAD